MGGERFSFAGEVFRPPFSFFSRTLGIGLYSCCVIAFDDGAGNGDVYWEIVFEGSLLELLDGHLKEVLLNSKLH